MDKIAASFFRHIPFFRGKQRLTRLFYRDQEFLGASRYIRVNNGIILKVPSLFDSIGYELFINGSYEPYLLDHYIRTIPVNGILYDVGANIGAVSVFIAKQRPDVTVIAIEASPFIYSFLQENKEINKINNLHLYNYAIHEQDDLELKFYAPKDQFGKGSFHETYTHEFELVKTISLSTLIEQTGMQPTHIKIDVQGYEYFVFKGMENYFKKGNPSPEIIFEFESWAETIAFGSDNKGIAQMQLKSFGYDILTFEPGKNKKIDGVVKEGSLILKGIPIP